MSPGFTDTPHLSSRLDPWNAEAAPEGAASMLSR
jgi:hypothetical protein